MTDRSWLCKLFLSLVFLPYKMQNRGMEHRASRPAGLHAVPIIALILGLLGCVGGTWGVGMTVFQMQAFGDMYSDFGSMGNDGMDAMGPMMELQRISAPITIALGAFNALASVLLVVGAAFLYTKKSFAPNLYTGVAGFSIFYAVVSLAGTAYLQIRSMQMMQEMMGDFGPGAGGPDMGLMMGGFGAIGICFGAVWGIAKISFYAWSAVYLRKPESRAFYAE